MSFEIISSSFSTSWEKLGRVAGSSFQHSVISSYLLEKKRLNEFLFQNMHLSLSAHLQMDINSKWLLSLIESLLTWNEQGKFHVVLQIHEFRSKSVCAKSIGAKGFGVLDALTT